MKKFIILFIAGISLLINTSNSQAIFIVDTGPGPNDNSVLFDQSISSVFAKFTLDKPYVLQSLEGWITSVPGTMNISIVEDNGQLPKLITDNSIPDTVIFTFPTLFQQDFDIQPAATPNWYGVYGINLALSQGDYWIGFNKLNFLGGMPAPSQNPLIDEAQFGIGFVNLPVLVLGLDFSENDDLNLGVRIQGEAAVPEPASMFLMAGGLTGFFLKRRNKTKV